MATRLCPNCNSEKPLSEWVRSRTRSSGVASYCKECMRARSKKTYHTNPQRAKEWGTDVSLLCETCGKAFTVKVGQSGKRKNCSKECQAESGRRKARPLAERFWKHTEKVGDCLLWTGASHPTGYGLTSFKGKTARAHRVAYILTHGHVPKGMFVCHRCDNPQCVNPEHLFLGTPKDNTRDMLQKERHRPRRGESSPNAKLSAKDVAQIRAAEGEKQATLARRFGVDQSTISDVVRRVHWRHVPQEGGY